MSSRADAGCKPAFGVGRGDLPPWGGDCFSDAKARTPEAGLRPAKLLRNDIHNENCWPTTLMSHFQDYWRSFHRNIEAARRGAYLEIDSIGGTWQSQTQLLENVLGVIEAGYIDNLLLSHDAGWYNPACLDGMPEEGFRSYTVLMTEFFPALREYGVTEEQISRITIDNPARAFAFNSFAYPGCSPS